jgi:hypothetical protein
MVGLNFTNTAGAAFSLKDFHLKFPGNANPTHDLRYRTLSLIHLEHPLGIRCRAERIHAVLLVVRCKVFDAVMVLDAVPIPIGMAEEILSLKLHPHQNRLCFLCPFFAQAKKVGAETYSYF